MKREKDMNGSVRNEDNMQKEGQRLQVACKAYETPILTISNLLLDGNPL